MFVELLNSMANNTNIVGIQWDIESKKRFYNFRVGDWVGGHHIPSDVIIFSHCLIQLFYETNAPQR